MSETKLVQFDWAIKYLLRNKANFGILEGFLSELLGTDVTIISLLESESNQEDPTNKTNRVDVFATLKDGEKVIIEVQCIRQWDFLSRMLFGVSKVVVEHLKKGEQYGKIPRIISVNIVYFDMGQGQDYIYRGRTQFEGVHKHDILKLTEKEQKAYPPYIKELSDIFPEYFVIKVDQFISDRVKDKLDEWMYFFKNSAIKPEFNAKGIQEAANCLNLLQLSENKRRQYDSYLENLRDEKSLITTHYMDGLATGLATGTRDTEARIIKKMHVSGISISEIAQIISLSEDDIKKLLDVPTDLN